MLFCVIGIYLFILCKTRELSKCLCQHISLNQNWLPHVISPIFFTMRWIWMHLLKGWWIRFTANDQWKIGWVLKRTKTNWCQKINGTVKGLISEIRQAKSHCTHNQSLAFFLCCIFLSHLLRIAFESLPYPFTLPNNC